MNARRWTHLAGMTTAIATLGLGASLARADGPTGSTAAGSATSRILAGPETPPPTTQPGERTFSGERKGANIPAFIRDLADSLDLTREQKTKVAAITDEFRARVKEFDRQHGAERKTLEQKINAARAANDQAKLEELRPKHDALAAQAPRLQDTIASLREVLTPAQQATFDQKMAAHREEEQRTRERARYQARNKGEMQGESAMPPGAGAGAATQPAAGASGRRAQPVAGFLYDLMQSLDLTPDQKTKVAAIADDFHGQMRSFEQAHGSERTSLEEQAAAARQAGDQAKLQEIRTKREALMAQSPKPQEAFAKVRALLTPDQQKVLDVKVEARIAEMKQRFREQTSPMMNAGASATQPAGGENAAPKLDL